MSRGPSVCPSVFDKGKVRRRVHIGGSRKRSCDSGGRQRVYSRRVGQQNYSWPDAGYYNTLNNIRRDAWSYIGRYALPEGGNTSFLEFGRGEGT